MTPGTGDAFSWDLITISWLKTDRKYQLGMKLFNELAPFQVLSKGNLNAQKTWAGTCHAVPAAPSAGVRGKRGPAASGQVAPGPRPPHAACTWLPRRKLLECSPPQILSQLPVHTGWQAVHVLRKVLGLQAFMKAKFRQN